MSIDESSINATIPGSTNLLPPSLVFEGGSECVSDGECAAMHRAGWSHSRELSRLAVWTEESSEA